MKKKNKITTSFDVSKITKTIDFKIDFENLKMFSYLEQHINEICEAVMERIIAIETRLQKLEKNKIKRFTSCK